MKIKTKLLIGSMIAAIIMLMLASAGVINIMRSNSQLEVMYNEQYAKMKLAYQLRGEFNKIGQGLGNLLINSNDDAERTIESLESFRNMQRNGDQIINDMRNMRLTATEKSLLDELAAVSEQNARYLEAVAKVIEAGDLEAAQELKVNEGDLYQRELVGQSNYFADYQNNNLDEAFQSSLAGNRTTMAIMSVITVVGLILAIWALMWNMNGIHLGLTNIITLINRFKKGRLGDEERDLVKYQGEFGQIAEQFIELSDIVEGQKTQQQIYLAEAEGHAWVKTNANMITLAMQGQTALDGLSDVFIQSLAPLVGAHHGIVYVREGLGSQNSLKAYAAYAFEDAELFQKIHAFGQGLPGQCAQGQEKIVLHNLPPEYIKVRSGLGEASPNQVKLVPLLANERVVGVIELAFLQEPTKIQKELLEEAIENAGLLISNLFDRIRIDELLKESQAMSEELQVQAEELISQQEEMRRSNERLEEQTKELIRSEELLQSQQEELEQTNEQLLSKTHLLELQVRQTEQKNRQIERTRMTLEKQAVQLAMSSKYKSEFLANMSHELRTPLNSLLILSQMLKDNADGNLTDKQVEFASTIYSSGNDLLKLIDEILDLSKISAGKMDIVTEHVPLQELDLYFRRSFTPISLQKNLAFETKLGENVPKEIFTDSHRLKQILKNLLSNAFKFTSHGKVELAIRPANPDEAGIDEALGKQIAFEVRDTGIGIPESKQQIVFEAFQQVDGTTSRIYGGTGLGLAISRELATLLGGKITMQSEEGKGSVFTLYLPEFYLAADNQSKEIHDEVLESPLLKAHLPQYAEMNNEAAVASAMADEAAEREEQVQGQRQDQVQAHQPLLVDDDAGSIGINDKVVLIIEDDINFAKVLLDIARIRGFKGIVALQGDKGLSYARTYKPDAILLDIQLPVMDGWTILNQLKQHPLTRHIPVHVISVVDEVQQGLSMGALAYLKKPASKEKLDAVFTQIEAFIERDVKQLLVVDDDAKQRESIIELIGYDDVRITAVGTGKEALEELRKQHYDCMVLDLGLPDMTGFELLDEIRNSTLSLDLPIIVYTGRDLDKKEEIQLKKYAGTIIIKDVKSPERLLDETTLFLHRVESNLPEDKRNILRKLHSTEAIFHGKHVLLVDDDIRNVFALSSVLESYSMKITFAENGHEALEKLAQYPEIDLVLMDMMMPEMDGYETMRAIRENETWDKLPIIAITAKAMKDDRDKCISAGASDYIAKPVNTEQLLSLMRVWLYQ